MRKILPFIGLFIFMLFTQSIFAQKTITGKIKDDKGNPISGASIKIKNTNKGTNSASDGTFSLIVNENDVIEISGVGLAKREIAVANNNTFDIAMETEASVGENVVVLGTRGVARAKTETAVPIDVIKINQVGLPTAKMDFTSVLNMAAPSFNYNKQSGADGADHIDLGTLRGLGPDQTLVLLNGKRRHTTAFVALFGTRGRGQSGTDLNAFPQSAVDRIEILRDGASAQYGSDAIAGVMNLILKKDINHWTINAGFGGYYDTKFNAANFNSGNPYYSGKKLDGNTYSFSVNNGVALGKNGGFINFSLDFRDQGKTYRQVDTINWQTDKNALPSLNTGRRAFGDGSVTTIGGMYNMEIPLSSSGKVTFYSFGGQNHKSSDAFAYTRNWSARPQRFPVDANGNLLFDGNIMRKSTDGEIYYNPHIQTKINDVSVAAGIKGTFNSGWKWDLSNTAGKNDFHYYGDKTYNASIIGNNSKTHFDDGGFNFAQNTLNFDMSKSFATVASGLNIGLGAEYRSEKYNIYSGQLDSYYTYAESPIFYPNVGESRYPAGGSQGFPGFSNTDAINAKRSNIGLYADAELNVSKEWLLDGAVRFENYSDFGAVTTFKLASRYKASKNVNIRGSISSGFRAPSLQQINFSNTLTSFSGGQLVQSLIARNGSNISKAAGIPNLKQETSTNASLGFSWKVMNGLTLTIDGYQVAIKDRVVLSGLFSKDDPTLPSSFTSQLPTEVSTVQFFANAVNTTNYGLDIVADYSKKWNNNSFKALLAGNFQKTRLDQIKVPNALNGTELNRKTFYNDREIAFLKASAPNAKFSLSLSYSTGNFGVGLNTIYYGGIKLLGFGDATPDNPNQTGINPQVPTDVTGEYVPEVFDYKGKVVNDVFVSYKLSKNVSIFTGVDNVANIHPNLGSVPTAKYWAGDNESGGAWDSVQMGFNGRKIFIKLAFNF